MVTDRRTGKAGRDGEPNADCVYASVYHNRALLAIADGCNWGQRSARASHDALEGVSSYLQSHEADMTTLQDTGHLLLRAVCEANKKVYAAGTELWEIGTTTLLCGAVVEVVKDEETDEREWVWICASVGDCKAMLWNAASGRITDVTMDNRCADMRDPGGRLGPYAGSDPDLRNLTLYFRVVRPGDIIALCSDGVYDNFDPIFLGKTPRDIGLNYDDWDHIPDDVAERSKEFFVTNYAADLLRRLPRVTPTSLADTWIRHAVQQTAGARRFMEENPGKRQPNDYKQFPGKMDHTSALAYLVGGRPSKAAPVVDFTASFISSVERTPKAAGKKGRKKRPSKAPEEESESVSSESESSAAAASSSSGSDGGGDGDDASDTPAPEKEERERPAPGKKAKSKHQKSKHHKKDKEHTKKEAQETEAATATTTTTTATTTTTKPE